MAAGYRLFHALRPATANSQLLIVERLVKLSEEDLVSDVKDDTKSFGLSREDAKVQNECRTAHSVDCKINSLTLT